MDTLGRLATQCRVFKRSAEEFSSGNNADDMAALTAALDIEALHEQLHSALELMRSHAPAALVTAAVLTPAAARRARQVRTLLQFVHNPHRLTLRRCISSCTWPSSPCARMRLRCWSARLC